MKTNSIDETLDVRGTRYGTFEDNAHVAQELKRALRRGVQYQNLAADQMEALDQLCSKMSRIVTGDPMYDDNWRDISGYATLVLNRLSPPSSSN